MFPLLLITYYLILQAAYWNNINSIFALVCILSDCHNNSHKDGAGILSVSILLARAIMLAAPSFMRFPHLKK